MEFFDFPFLLSALLHRPGIVFDSGLKFYPSRRSNFILLLHLHLHLLSSTSTISYSTTCFTFITSTSSSPTSSISTTSYSTTSTSSSSISWPPLSPSPPLLLHLHPFSSPPLPPFLFPSPLLFFPSTHIHIHTRRTLGFLFFRRQGMKSIKGTGVVVSRK